MIKNILLSTHLTCGRAALDQAIALAGTPISITVDHGTEFTSKALEEWAYQRGVKLDFIHPGKPTENGKRLGNSPSLQRVRLGA